MRVTQVLALLLIVASALSFGLSIYSVLKTDWNREQSNWFVGTETTCIFFSDHYIWFFGFYHKSFVINDFDPFKSFYSPFPSVLGGIYFLVCGIVFWFVKNENPRLPWYYWGNKGDMRPLLLGVGGASAFCLSMFSVFYQTPDTRLDIVYPYIQYCLPLAFLGTAFIALGIVGTHGKRESETTMDAQKTT